ncbi:MAG: polynucleotide adenylyltransferase PcnB [Gammaproteobacteria bacterium]|nr:polynucleotide adenylyltransferase PcnB [Gammaproteobacteria bacterium]
MSEQPLEPARLSPKQHGVTRKRVDANALDVTDRLTEAGYQAMLVGGCVRDLLLGVQPKDFDVATSATPEQVRHLFRRSRLVGRRFRIAHVRYGRDIIEVSTFRKSQSTDEHDERLHDESGLILRDNVYGSLHEDAFRRDFTVNALYYDPLSGEVLDFVGGLADLSANQLRFIGEPRVRIREDPVRVLRALRFQAKLGLTLDPAIKAELPGTARLLEAIPAARLFDEVLKLFMYGYAAKSWELLAASPLGAVLFPATPKVSNLVQIAMANTDARIAENKPVTPGFLVAVLLWDDYLARCTTLEATRKPAEARALAASEAVSAQQRITAIPRRFSHFARDVWSLQGRLEKRPARSITRVYEHGRFRAAYDFLLFRAASDHSADLEEAATWWTTYQECDADERDAMLDARRSAEPKRKRRRRRRRSQPSDS